MFNGKDRWRPKTRWDARHDINLGGIKVKESWITKLYRDTSEESRWGNIEQSIPSRERVCKERRQGEIARLDFVLARRYIAASPEEGKSSYYAGDARDLNSRLSRNLCPRQDENQINRPYFNGDAIQARNKFRIYRRFRRILAARRQTFLHAAILYHIILPRGERRSTPFSRVNVGWTARKILCHWSVKRGEVSWSCKVS